MSCEESYWGNLAISYKTCIITGIVLPGFFYYFTFRTTGKTNYANDGTGIISILVVLSPAASGAITLMEKNLVSYEKIILISALIVHLLSMFVIVFDIVRKIPVPKHFLVLVSGIWAFTSIGIIILVIIAVKFPDLIKGLTGGNNRNNDLR